VGYPPGRRGGWRHAPGPRLSTLEHRPADRVARALVVQDERPNRIRELFALPTTLEPSGASALARGSRGPHRLDRVGRSTKLVCGDMGDHRGLAGSECRVPGCSAQPSRRRHRVTTRSAGLGHRGLAASPGPNPVDGMAGPGVRRLPRLEEVQDVLGARGRPQSQEPMVGVRERAPAADGDEPGVAVLGQDHGFTVRRRCPSVDVGVDASSARTRRSGSRWRPASARQARRTLSIGLPLASSSTSLSR
jgi:hypothetical protein